MANNKQNTEQATSVAANKQPGKKLEQNRYTNMPKSNSKLIFNGLTLAAASVAMIVAIYSMHSSQQSQERLAAVQEELSTELNKLQQSQETAKQLFDNASDSIKQTQTDFDNKINLLNRQLESALNQKHYEKNDWVFLKAKYYLELAQINAYWSKNTDSTVSLLEQADLLLKDIHNPNLFSIRQIISKEISQLKTTEQIDITGLLSQIDAAQLSVNKLAIKTIASQEDNANKIATQNQNKAGWRSQFQNSMDFLKTLVVVRHIDEPIQPIISPLYETALKESLHLYLQEAQWAVLNNNQDVFQLSLEQAIKNIQSSFNPNSQSTKGLIKQLTSLKETQLTQAKPEIGKALPLLIKLIEAKTTLEDHTPQEKGE